MVTTIPSQFDPKTALSLPNLGGDFDVADAVRRMKDFAEIDQQQSVFRQQSGEAAKTGEMTSSAGAASAMMHRDSVAKQKDKDARDMVETQMLLATLRDLEEARGYAVEELSDIRENKAALKTLKTLHENGELDPANEEHQKLMKKAGITREDLMTDPTGAFARQAKFWDEREQNKIKEIEGIDRDIARTQKIVDASPEERRKLLSAGDKDIADAAIASEEVAQDIVTDALIDRGFTQEETVYQANAAQNGLFGNDGFESSNTFESTKSFASTLDMGEPPAMLNLSADFDVAANASAPSEPLPVLDLSSEFKFQ